MNEIEHPRTKEMKAWKASPRPRQSPRGAVATDMNELKDGDATGKGLNAPNLLRTDIVIMGIIVIGVVACMFDLLMRWVERERVPWKGRM
jgi:ABC-type nitrate/sulfonate/bicarbonate transport system permease component